MSNSKPILPFTIVIFGATGDLTHRKIVPALYTLWAQGLLPEQFNIIGFARRDWTDELFRAEMQRGLQQFGRLPFDPARWEKFAPNLHYHRSEFDQAEGYPSLAAKIDQLDNGATGNRLFYLATPPDAYPAIVRHLGEAGLNHNARTAIEWRCQSVAFTYNDPVIFTE